MLLLGFEPQDVLRVAVGIALGLLTVYRRELSCNRDYHPDEYDETLGNREHGPSLHDRGGDSSDSSPLRDDHEIPSRAMVIPRRKSSSSLLTASHHDENRRVTDVISDKNNEDPTEELLESAGFFLSGGPFLHIAIAVFHHLVITNFIYNHSSFSSLLRGFTTNIYRFFPGTPHQENSISQQTPESIHAGNETTRQDEQQLYSVAWNAVTEYFTSISTKFDRSHGTNKGSGDFTSSMKYSRSKSTGNLQQCISDDHSRALFREMVAMKILDVTLLPSDAQIQIFSYLPPADVLAFMCTNKAGRNLLDDGYVAAAQGDDNGGAYVKNGDTALLIWKSLFHRDYSWVLSDWDIGIEAFQRSMANYHCHQQRQQPSPKAGKVFRHLLSTIVHSEYTMLPFGSMIAASSSIHPTTSMKDFYFIFSETWLNYTIAGCNSTEKCLIGLHGHVFDISSFVAVHPGSTETLLLQSGRDATVFFESMGHSLGARRLALGMCVVVNGQCTRWNFTGGEEMCGSLQLGAVASGPPFSTCGLIKPKCRSLDLKRNIPGFLIPRKRSLPRIQGALHHTRERLRREEELELVKAARWGNASLGPNGLFGGVHVYYDPFRGWQWWYTDRDFNVVYIEPTH